MKLLVKNQLRAISYFLSFILLAANPLLGQDTTVTIGKENYVSKEISAVDIRYLPGWLYKKGTTVFPENNIHDSTRWKIITPELNYAALKSHQNYIGTWFHLTFILDSSFGPGPVYLQMLDNSIYYLYLNDSLIGLHGERTGNGEFQHKSSSYKDHIIQTDIEIGKVYELKIFFVTDFKPVLLQSAANGIDALPGITLLSASALEKFNTIAQIVVFWQSVLIVLIILFWLLYFLNREEKVTALAALVVSIEFLSITGGFDNFFSRYIISDHYRGFLSATSAAAWVSAIPILLSYIFTSRIPRILYVLLVTFILLGIAIPILNLPGPLLFLPIISSAICTIYFTIRAWKKIHGAQWVILGGLLLTIVFLILFLLGNVAGLIDNFYLLLFLYTAFTLVFPLSLLLYVAVRFRKLLFDTRQKAIDNIRLAEEKLNTEQENKRILAKQNEFLETEVELLF